jgi:gamma-glutamyltranspeptidase/glutathione hydrolase
LLFHLEHAQKRYGVLPQAKVMEPAIRLAEDGYAITKLQRRQMNWCLRDLVASSAAAKLFLKKGRPFRAGDIFRQKELAATVRRLADIGVQDFYQGEIARAIAEEPLPVGSGHLVLSGGIKLSTILSVRSVEKLKQSPLYCLRL